MSQRDKLITKANSLALEFPGNISSEKLQALIDDASGPEVKSSEPKEEPADSTPLSKRERIAKIKKAAMKMVVVTITNKDNRENDVMTTVFLSFENQYFGVAKHVPLDVPVEVEQALIDIAESTTMTLPKDEIVRGQRTGNKVAVTVKKFAVSYSKN